MPISTTLNDHCSPLRRVVRLLWRNVTTGDPPRKTWWRRFFFPQHLLYQTRTPPRKLYNYSNNNNIVHPWSSPNPVNHKKSTCEHNTITFYNILYLTYWILYYKYNHIQSRRRSQYNCQIVSRLIFYKFNNIFLGMLNTYNVKACLMT